MARFFVESVAGDSHVLTGADAAHAAKSLRMRAGERLTPVRHGANGVRLRDPVGRRGGGAARRDGQASGAPPSREFGSPSTRGCPKGTRWT